ncbi:ATP-binding cassette domain-containing protein [Streptomyces sp. NPDC048639]|uniref:ATP-binding cassette domain-containing protein n=1 Tax=Streptomyces sp. NPDC048639 TaxID=3365581 RepID=UPI0037249FF5
MGPPGAGKSTLLRCASGLERPSQGKVFQGSRELDAMDEQELTELRGLLVPQQPALLTALTTYEALAQGLCATDRTARRTAVMEALRHVGLEEEAGQNPAGLSAEQQKLVAIVMGRGAVGFDLQDLDWGDEPDRAKAFILRTVELALCRHRWNELGYEPPFAETYLHQIKHMVSEFDPTPSSHHGGEIFPGPDEAAMASCVRSPSAERTALDGVPFCTRP